MILLGKDLPKTFRKQKKFLKIYYVSSKKTSPRFAKAFAKGSGGKLAKVNKYQLGNWAGFGSPVTWQSLQQAQKLGFDWFYIKYEKNISISNISVA